MRIGKSFTERRNVPQTQNNEGILDPSAFGDLDGYTDFDFMMYKEQKQNDLPDNTILFCVHIEQKNKGISVPIIIYTIDSTSSSRKLKRRLQMIFSGLQVIIWIISFIGPKSYPTSQIRYHPQ